MKSAWSRTLLSLFAFSVILYSCNKDDDDTIGKVNTNTAGKGGNSDITVVPLHDSLHIDSCMIYIKYNADTATIPITVFDDSIKCERVNGISQVKFVQLKKGNYFIYGHGWDLVRSLDVKGTLNYSVTTENTAYTATLKMKHLE